MAFWIGIAVTLASVLTSFVWAQKTFPIRLALFALGLIGVGLTADRYFEDQKKQQQTLEYWEDARLNAFALHFIGGDLEDHTELNNIIGAYIHNQNGKVVWDCSPSSIEAYTKAVNFDPKFPFSYFYRASCNRLNNVDQCNFRGVEQVELKWDPLECIGRPACASLFEPFTDLIKQSNPTLNEQELAQ